jgi:hypothetical protein
MGRPYDVSRDTPFVGVGPPIDARKRSLVHGKVAARAIPGALETSGEEGREQEGDPSNTRDPGSRFYASVFTAN